MTLSQSAGGATISLAIDRDQRLGFQRAGDRGGETVAIDGERAAGRQLVAVGRAHHQRIEAAHFGMQKADGAALGIVGAERVGADQLGELSGLVCGGRAKRPHFVQHHWHAAARELPGGLGTRKAAADDMNRPQGAHHVGKLGASGRADNDRRW